MRALSTLASVIGLGAIAASLASTAHAGDWSIDVDVGVPGFVVVAPPPVYIAPPPRYYRPGYYPPEYYPPRYYRPPVADYDRDEDGYRHHRGWHHRHHEDDDDDE